MRFSGSCFSSVAFFGYRKSTKSWSKGGLTTGWIFVAVAADEAVGVRVQMVHAEGVLAWLYKVYVEVELLVWLFICAEVTTLALELLTNVV